MPRDPLLLDARQARRCTPIHRRVHSDPRLVGSGIFHRSPIGGIQARACFAYCCTSVGRIRSSASASSKQRQNEAIVCSTGTGPADWILDEWLAARPDASSNVKQELGSITQDGCGTFARTGAKLRRESGWLKRPACRIRRERQLRWHSLSFRNEKCRASATT